MVRTSDTTSLWLLESWKTSLTKTTVHRNKTKAELVTSRYFTDTRTQRPFQTQKNKTHTRRTIPNCVCVCFMVKMAASLCLLLKDDNVAGCNKQFLSHIDRHFFPVKLINQRNAMHHNVTESEVMSSDCLFCLTNTTKIYFNLQ